MRSRLNRKASGMDSAVRKSLSRAAAPSLRTTLGLAAAVAAGVASLFSSRVQAAAETWTGTNGSTFNTTGNWTGTNPIPLTGDSLVFTSATGTGGLNLNNDLTSGSFTVASITFNAGAAAFVIGNGTGTANTGNTFILGGNITNIGTNLETVNNPFSTTAVRTISMTAGGGNVALGGDISGTGGGILLAGTGTLTLSGNNSFTGSSVTSNGDTVTAGVTVVAGTTLSIGSNTALGNAAAYLNLGAGTVQAVGGAKTVANGLFTNNVNGFIAGSNDLTFNGQLFWSGTNTLTVNNSGLTTFAGGMTIRNSGVGGRTVTLAGSGNVLVSGVIANGAAAQTGAVTYAGSGTLTLTALNSYTGITRVNSGTIAEDFSQNAAPTTATNIISSTSALNLAGGTLLIKGGGSGASNSQTFASTTFVANGGSYVVINQNNATAVNLTLGGLTRNSPSTVDFTLPTAGTVSTTTTTSIGTNKINGASVAYSTVAGTTWLTNNAGTLTGLAAILYQTDAFVASGDSDVTNDLSPTAFTVNTLRFNVAGKTLTLNSSGVSTVTSGGILVTSAGTGVTIASGGGSASLAAGAGGEIVIHDYGTLNLAAPISGATKLTLAGTGTTTISVANSFTGATALIAGTTNLSGSLTGGGAVGITNGTLNVSGTINNSAITVNSFGTLSETSAGSIGGTASLTVNGVASLGGTNGYSGTTSVGATGRLNINSVGALGTGAFTIGGIVDGTNGTISSQTNSPAIALAGFTYGGTNSINVGTGAVTTGGDTTINLAGNNSNTFTFGGTFTNTNAAARTLTVNNATGVSGETLVFNNGFNLATAGTAVQYVFAGTGNITVNGVVANGSGSTGMGITKNGTGALTLAGANSFTGVTTLNGGILNINNAAAVSGSTLNINNATAILDNTSGSAITTSTFNPAITMTTGFAFGGSYGLNLGNGTVAISGDRVITLNGNNSNTLTFGGLLQSSLAAGAFNITVNNAAGVSGETLVFDGGFNMQTGAGAGGGNFLVSGNGKVTFNGTIANGSATANNLNYQGTGTMAIGGTATYTGTTQVSNAAGTLQLTGTLGSGGGTAITVAGTLNETSAGVITSGSSLTVTTGTAILAGANNYSGTTGLTGAGTINVNSAGALGSGAFTISGGTINNTSGSAITGQTNNPAITLGNAFAFGGSNSLNLGTGTVSNNGDRIITLNGNNSNTLTFGGLLQSTNVGGAFNIAVNNASGVSGETVIFNGGYNMQAAAGTGGATSIFSGSGKIIVNGVIANGSGTGNMNLQYSGTGRLTVTGNNTYTGLTTISSGTMLVNNVHINPTDSGTGTGNVAVNGGTLGGTGFISGTVNIASGADLAAGNLGVGTLTTGALTLNNASNLDYDLGTPGTHVAPGTGDLVAVNGALVLDGVLNITDAGGFGVGSYQLFSYIGAFTDSALTLPASGYLGFNYSLDTSTSGAVYLDVSTAPEPTSLSIIGLSMTGLLSRRRRNRTAKTCV